MTAIEAARNLAKKQQELSALYDKYDTKRQDSAGRPIYDFADGVETEIDLRLSELAELNDECSRIKHAENSERVNASIQELGKIDRKYASGQGGSSYVSGINREAQGQFKTLGEMVANHFEYKNRDKNRGKFHVNLDEVDMKTLLSTIDTSSGLTPDSPRGSLVVPYPNRRPLIADLIPTSPTNLQIIKWMEQVLFTNNASMTGEAYLKPESALDWIERTATVRKVAHWIPVTEEQVDDVPGFQSLLNNDMILMLKLKEEYQLLYGTEVGQELKGFLSAANTTLQTQAFSVNNADTVLKAMTKIQWTGYASPTGVVMNPSNWETIRLLKGATNQDYVLGSPLIDVQPRLWGVPVVVTNAINANEALVGDFVLFSEIRRMAGIRVDVSDSHDTFFIYDKLAVRAEERLALVIKRGSAFCKCTSLT